MLSVLYTFIVLFAVCIEYYKFSALLKIFIFGSTVYEELVIEVENNL